MILFRGMDEVYTLSGAVKKNGRKITERDLSRKKNVVILVERGQVVGIQPLAKLSRSQRQKIRKEFQFDGGLVLPGLVDCHTHSVFAGSRSEEFEMRNRGVSYQQIAARGGGILSTMKATRKASEAQLVKLGQERMNRFVAQGVTAVEIKSGYALDRNGEMKMLQAAGKLKGPQVVRTFLGAHAIPPEYTEIEYIQKLIEDLPKMRPLAERVDIFIERGYFGRAQARQYLQSALDLGFSVTIHADQLNRTGATGLGVEKGAQSVDHVVQIQTGDIKRLANSETIAVLLPSADFYLKMKYPPARKLIDAGAQVALATDFNPGSSPSQSVEFVGLLARLEMGMSLPEVLGAWTFNGAQALGLKDQGHLCPGAQANFCHLNMDYSELFYQLGQWNVTSTFRKGRRIFRQ